MSTLAPLLQGFFTDRLIRQRQASPHTIIGYRDTWRLLVTFAAARAGTTPLQLSLADLDATTIGAFLDYLATVRHNTASTPTADWPPYTRCSATRHRARQKTPPSYSGCSPSRTGEPTGPWSRPHHTEIDALLTAPDWSTWACLCIMPSRWPASRPGCEPPRSSGCAAQTSSSAPVPTSACTARAAKSASSPSPPKACANCAHG